MHGNNVRTRLKFADIHRFVIPTRRTDFVDERRHILPHHRVDFHRHEVVAVFNRDRERDVEMLTLR